MPETDFLAACHFVPEAVRTVRGALDNGVSVTKLKKTLNKFPEMMPQIRESFCSAIDYMASNPDAGKVRWVEGRKFEFIHNATLKGD